jgi:opacity protein-like surface antigen
MAVDYRYLAGEDAEFDLDAGAGRFRSDFGSHNVLASLRYDF